MNEIEQLNERIKQLEQQLAVLPQKILSEVKKLVSMHTHTFGSKVMWEYPPEAVKQALENLVKSSNKGPPPANFSEIVKPSDTLTIKMEKVE